MAGKYMQVLPMFCIICFKSLPLGEHLIPLLIVLVTIKLDPRCCQSVKFNAPVTLSSAGGALEMATSVATITDMTKAIKSSPLPGMGPKNQ